MMLREYIQKLQEIETKEGGHLEVRIVDESDGRLIEVGEPSIAHRGLREGDGLWHPQHHPDWKGPKVVLL